METGKVHLRIKSISGYVANSLAGAREGILTALRLGITASLQEA